MSNNPQDEVNQSSDDPTYLNTDERLDKEKIDNIITDL